MAGWYPDVPGNRIAYDRDGTFVIRANNENWSSIVSEWHKDSSVLRAGNGENPGNLGWNHGPTNGSNMFLSFIFPEPLNLIAIMIAGSVNRGVTAPLAYSLNTTNGIDGDWVTILENFPISSVNDLHSMRNEVLTFTEPLGGIIGLRWGSRGGANTTQRFSAVHLYGDYVDTNRIKFWHPTLDEELDGAYFDWGDVYRGQIIAPRPFRIKNCSESLVANDIVISKEALTDNGTQTTVSAHKLSDDELNWEDSLLIDELNPEEISDLMWLRYSPSTDANLSLRWMRLNIEVDSWT